MSFGWSLLRSFVLISVALVIFAPDAYAYLDPGTGSLVVQSLIAAAAAVGYAVRLHWTRIRMWFKRSEHDDRA